MGEIHGDGAAMSGIDAAHIPATEKPALSWRLSEELDRYRGQWVAVDNDTLVAVAASAQEVVRLANQKGCTDSIVFRVRLHPEQFNIP